MVSEDTILWLSAYMSYGTFWIQSKLTAFSIACKQSLLNITSLDSLMYASECCIKNSLDNQMAYGSCKGESANGATITAYTAETGVLIEANWCAWPFDVIKPDSQN